MNEMQLTKPQKTIIICSTFIAGTAAALINLFPLFAVISILLISFFAYKKDFSVKFALFLLFVAGFSFFYCKFKTPQPDELYKKSPAKINLIGRVITEPRTNSTDRTKFEFEVWQPVKAKTIVSIYDKQRKFKNILIGDVLELNGFVKPPYEATNPGQFDYKKYLQAKEIFTLTNVKYDAWKVIEHPKNGKWLLIQSLNKFKNEIINKNRKYIKSPKLEILEGMVLGDYAIPSPEEVKQTFLKSGLLHLLAASGMNVGFIFGFWFFFATKLKIPYRLKMIAGAVLVLLYSLLTGLPPSIMRAAAMMEFLIIGKIFNRKADTLTLLALICAISVLTTPFLLANVGFQLSYITTLGILLCTEPLLKKTKPIPEALSGAIIVPFIAQIWASPIQIFHFNNFSPYSLLANILVLPFVGIITFLGFTGNILSFLPLIGNKILWLSDKLAEPCINIVLFIAEYVSRFPNSLYNSAKPEILAVIIFYCLVFTSLFIIKKDFSSKKLNLTALILAICLTFFVFKDSFNTKLEILFFDIGQGDAILIHTPNNKNILVDTGPNGRFIPANAVILPYLKSKGINSLDAMVLTHPDNDHIGGTTSILKNIDVKTLFHNGFNHNSKTCKKISAYIAQNRIKNTFLANGQEINLDKEINIKAIIPPDINKNSDNENSIILYVSYKDFSTLLMADCEANSINYIKKYVKLPIKIIKVGHHGSLNSVNQEFLNYLKPQIAVISVGERGYKYGHPNPDVLKELNISNIKTLRTDKDFAINISSDGKNYSYDIFAEQKIQP